MTGIDISRLGPAAQRQILQKFQAKEVEAKTRSKYGNEKIARVMPNGTAHTFDSKKEANRYDELALLLSAGKIKDLRLQQTFTLQEAYTSSDGERVRAITYKADFVYSLPKCEMSHGTGIESKTDNPCSNWWLRSIQTVPVTWVLVVEDVKSTATRTKEYSMKRKMMQDRLGITIREV